MREREREREERERRERESNEREKRETETDRQTDRDLAPEAAPSPQGIQEFFKVITVEVGAAEDEAVVHFERLHQLDQRRQLEAFDALGPAQGVRV